jgi:hypothetical protein
MGRSFSRAKKTWDRSRAEFIGAKAVLAATTLNANTPASTITACFGLPGWIEVPSAAPNLSDFTDRQRSNGVV